MIEKHDEVTFDISVSARVAATPDEVYAVASDITRMGEWSPENTGGTWSTDQPGTVGARFHGHNSTGEFTFTTECEVVDADPGRRFAWVVLTAAPVKDTSEWSFEIDTEGDATVLTQRYVLRGLTDKLREFCDGLPEEKAAAFMAGRRAQLRDGMHATVEGIRAVVES